MVAREGLLVAPRHRETRPKTIGPCNGWERMERKARRFDPFHWVCARQERASVCKAVNCAEPSSRAGTS